MSPRLKRELERQLTSDISHYVDTTPSLVFDWTGICIEGHSAELKGERIHNWSGIGLLTSDKKIIGSGWMEFCTYGLDEPVVYWEFLTIQNQTFKGEPGIPDHVWNQLPHYSQAFYKSVRMTR